MNLYLSTSFNLLMNSEQATLSFDGAMAGSILGVFTLGIFVPWANPIVNNHLI